MPWDTEDALRLDLEFASSLSDMSPAMSEAQQILIDAVEKNFQGESAAGDPWPSLVESTLEDRHRKGFGDGPILERTGELKNAATEHRQVGADYVEVGLQEGHPYGHFHASSAPRSKIPLRDFLAVDEAAIQRIEAAIIEHLEKGG